MESWTTQGLAAALQRGPWRQRSEILVSLREKPLQDTCQKTPNGVIEMLVKGTVDHLSPYKEEIQTICMHSFTYHFNCLFPLS